MKCPHCLVEFFANETLVLRNKDTDGFWKLYKQNCPNCGRLILRLECYDETQETPTIKKETIKKEFLVYPKGITRTHLSPDVPDEFAQDYKEACSVLNDSSKASAALSRRCLQKLLREKAGVKPQDLSKEIDDVIPSLPSHLSKAIDAIRNIGNFAAHPIKSISSNEIIDVEPGEAEWILDVLEGLFDFYFVQPAELQRKKDALNQKLTDAGKPTIK